VLSLLAIVGLAGFEAARFGSVAAQGQLYAAAALHAADTGLATHMAGTGAPTGSFRLRASWGEASVAVEPLVILADSSVIVRVESRGFAPAETTAVGRRYLEQLARIAPDGSRTPIRGSWREKM
jgi:hypothetical protein